MDRLGPYRVVAPIGEGGMGEVYRAIDERLGRTVAIKLLHAADATSAQLQLRLLREAQAASALDHPGVVTVFDVGVHDGRAYVVMELVSGESFSELAGKVTAIEALRLCAGAADAMAAAHDAGIMHRDLKSDNLMRTRDGRVKVLDFGLAKLQDGSAAAMATSQPGIATAADEDISIDETIRPQDLEISGGLDATMPATTARSGAALTQVGALIGTPLYMSPEQADRRPVTPRSEVFSLGVVLYELLTGTLPFVGDDVESTLAAIRAAAPVPPSQRKPSVPHAVDVLVARALAAAPEARFPDMRAFAAAIHEIDGTGPPRRSLAWPLVGVAAALIAGVVAVVVVTRRSETTATAPPPDGAPVAALPQLVVGEPRRLTALDGCEEFPSFADDGRTVIFDGARGKDYVLQAIDVASGAVRALTDVRGWDYASALSPDGTQLAFIRSDADGVGVWVMGYPTPTPPRKVSAGAIKPMWTARGKLWAGTVRKPTLHDLETGTVLRTIDAPDGLRFMNLAELADGRLAAVAGEAETQTVRGLAFIEADGTSALALVGSIDEVLVPIPGGVLIALARGEEATEVAFVGLDGTTGPVVGAEELQPRKGMALSPRGELVWSTCDTDYDIATLEAGSDKQREMRRISGGTWGDTQLTAVGATRMIALVSDRGGPDSLWLIDRESVAQPREIDLGGMIPDSPAASPDGREIAFSSNGALYVVPTDGSTAVRLLAGTVDALSPAWSADSRELYYQTSIDGIQTIVVMPADGGPSRPVVGGVIPELSRDGRMLAYRDLDSVPMLRDLRTGKSRPVSKALTSGPYDLIRLSPDGERAAVVLASNRVLEVDLRSGKLLHTFDAGGDQLTGLSYLGDELLVTRAIWQGDLWIAHAELVLP